MRDPSDTDLPTATRPGATAAVRVDVPAPRLTKRTPGHDDIDPELSRDTLPDGLDAPAPHATTETDDPLVGQRVDHFVLERKIGAGGMGAVYLARDVSLERLVALKALPAPLASRTELKERFLREARAQARLQSPHVAHIYFIGELPPDARQRRSLYFAMELVDGGSLDDLVERGERLEPERARRLLIEATTGLADAHAAGVIHRDIKPSNLLLDRRGALKIADFGLAKPVDDDDASVKLTQAGDILGSPHYMSPEQAMGDEVVDLRSDMYALGCTFFHVLAGHPPYDGNTPFAIVNQHVQASIPDVREHAPRVSNALAAIVRRLMAKKPAERFASYAELIDALEAADPKRTVHASFGARAAAIAIDFLIAGLAVGLLGWPGLVAHLVYVTVATTRYGQTLGKRLLHLRVRNVADGKNLTPGRSAVRTVANLWLPLLVGLVIALTQGTGELVDQIEHLKPNHLDAVKSWLVAVAVSNGLLSLVYASGLAMAAFHPRRQAVHDLIAGSEVVYELNAGSRAPASGASAS